MSFFWSYTMAVLLMLTGVFVIFLVLIQRGRGGGLAGAFGGLGGQSAFGTKAGDVFTRITIVAFVIWVILAAGGGFAMRYESEGRFKAAGGDAPAVPTATSASEESGGTTAGETEGAGENPFDGVLETDTPSGETGETTPAADESEAAGGAGDEEGRPSESTPTEKP